MSKLNEPGGRASHGEMLRSAWDQYQEAYMNFNLKEVPDFHIGAILREPPPWTRLSSSWLATFPGRIY